MSRVKVNPRCIKDTIDAVETSNLSITKKDTIIKVLTDYLEDKTIGLVFTDRECELLITLLSSEIMKMQLNYSNREPKRLQELYGIRDKIVNRRGE